MNVWSSKIFETLLCWVHDILYLNPWCSEPWSISIIIMKKFSKMPSFNKNIYWLISLGINYELIKFILSKFSITAQINSFSIKIIYKNLKEIILYLEGGKMPIQCM